MNTAWSLVAILGLAAITVVCRCFFLLPEREPAMPEWLKQGLRYAPLAALSAVVVPEIVTPHGQLISTLQDARIFGALAGLACYAWRRSILGTIVAGTGVMLLLRHALGW
jgi:branched-subunit amino acid transport protein